MLSKERMHRIMNLISEKSFITVKELMDEFHVSRSSVMRDLIELENLGLIQRERGGASAMSVSTLTLTNYNERPVADKELIQSEEKRMICEEAAKRIKDGDCIYIDSGTTPVHLLPYIMNKRVKIVTSSIYFIRKLPESFIGDVYLLGGEFSKKYDMSYGAITLDTIQKFNFDHAFFSSNGVNLENNEVYIFEFSIGAVKKEIMKRSSRNYLLVDSTKFRIKALCTWANTNEFEAVFVNAFDTDIELPENYIICK